MINVVTIVGDSEDVKTAINYIVGGTDKILFDYLALTNIEQIYDNTVTFNTKENLPSSVIKAMSTLSPNVKFKVQYASDDIGYNVGELTYQNGINLSSNVPNGGSYEAYKMAIGLTGDNYYITDFFHLVDEHETNQEFVSMCVKLAFHFRVLGENLPPFILKQFETMAVEEEDYEFASELVKLRN